MGFLYYEDFTLVVSAGRDGFQARVVNAPYGGSGELEFPYGLAELGDLLRALDGEIRGDGGAIRHGRSASAARLGTNPQEFGGEVFQALFSGAVGRAFQRSLGSIENRIDTGLRLRLHFDPSVPELAALAGVPWELLHDQATGDYLSRNVMTPVIRHLSVERRTAPPPLVERLRMLVVSSNPPGTARLELEAELERIEEIWGKQLGIEVEVLRQPGLPEIREALRSKPFQILHFMGHGSFDAVAEKGSLSLTSSGEAEVVPGTALAEMVKDTRALRLVVLNACETARFALAPGAPPYTGVASALLQAGVPAVIAMQFAITDSAARAFSDRFYCALAAGDLLESAVTEGRLAVFQHDRESWEWATPVLFMSLRDGIVFEASTGRLLIPGAGRELVAARAAGTPAPAAPAASDEQRRELRILLGKVETFWIDGVLESSLHDRVLLELGREQRSGLVDPPWQRVLEVSGEGRRVLPADRELTDVFSQAGGTLLILGEPGSGKTTTLLALARDLLAAAEDGERPIPVVFHLASWTRQAPSIGGWLIAELGSKYRIPAKTARQWLDRHRLLPLLDGLDEVRSKDRASCVEAINAFSETVGLTGLVVCSRLHEYDALPVRLKLQAAVVLQRLDTAQIEAYLDSGGSQLESLRKALHRDMSLRAMARSPLMLSVMSLAYGGGDVREVESAETREKQRKHLFETYVQRMFRSRSRDGTFADRAGFVRRLGWLARSMDQRHQKIFQVESLQPDQLESRASRWLYLLASRLLPSLPLSAAFIVAGILVRDWGNLLMALVASVAGTMSAFLGDARKFRVALQEDKNPQADGRPGGIAKSALDLSVFVLICTGIAGACFQGLEQFSWARDLVSERAPTPLDKIALAAILGCFLGALYAPRSRRQTSAADIGTVEVLEWSIRQALKSARAGASVGIVIGLCFGILQILYLISESVSGHRLSSLYDYVLGTGIMGGLVGLLVGGFSSKVLEMKATLNQGILMSLKRSLALGCGYFVVVSSVCVFFSGLDRDDLVLCLVIGILFGGTVAIWYGGLDVAQHYLLRLLLAREGKVPLRLSRFLDHAARCVFLQRVGGGYIFIHRLLQEHFAAIDAGEPHGRRRRHETKG